MKYNLFLLFSLFIASLFSIWAFSVGGADASSPEFIWADFVFWGIITVGTIPASIQFIREEYRALRNWVRTVVIRDTDAITDSDQSLPKGRHSRKCKSTPLKTRAKQRMAPSDLKGCNLFQQFTSYQAKDTEYAA